VHRRGIDAKHEADHEHAFTADHSPFQTGVAIDRRYQRDETFGGK
jgi:hypothetical protein